MFKKEIHDFLLANGFEYRKKAIAPYCRNQSAVWGYVYTHNKLNIYGDLNCLAPKVLTADCQRCDVNPLFMSLFKSVTLDTVKETLNNAGIFSDDLIDAFACLLKWHKDNSTIKYKRGVSVNANLKRSNPFVFNADEILGVRSHLFNSKDFGYTIFDDDFNYERNKTMKQEYQKITMSNLAETLEYNGFKRDTECESNSFSYIINNSAGTSVISWDYGADISFKNWLTNNTVREEFNLRKYNLSKFIKCVEAFIGELKRLPKKPKFNAEEYLIEKLQRVKGTILFERSYGIDLCRFTDGDIALKMKKEEYTKEQCDKIIEAVKILQEL
jgi:hypothetical protein